MKILTQSSSKFSRKSGFKPGFQLGLNVSLWLIFATIAWISTFNPAAQAVEPLDAEQIAVRAYWGELKGIPGYSRLARYWRSGQVSTEEIIEAAGETPSFELVREVDRWLHDLVDQQTD